jgi:hypothetical protein
MEDGMNARLANGFIEVIRVRLIVAQPVHDIVNNRLFVFRCNGCIIQSFVTRGC